MNARMIPIAFPRRTRFSGSRISGGQDERHAKKIFSGRGDFRRGAFGTEREYASSGRKTHADASARGEACTHAAGGHAVTYDDAGRGGPAARDGSRGKGLPPRGRASEEKNRSVQDDRRVGL